MAKQTLPTRALLACGVVAGPVYFTVKSTGIEPVYGLLPVKVSRQSGPSADACASTSGVWTPASVK